MPAAPEMICPTTCVGQYLVVSCVFPHRAVRTVMVSLLHRVSVITVRCEDGDHCGNPFLVVAMAQILDVGKDVAVMTVDGRVPAPVAFLKEA